MVTGSTIQINVQDTSYIHSTLRTRFQHRRQPHEAAQNDHRSKNAAQIVEDSRPKLQVRSEAGKKESVTIRSVQFVWCGQRQERETLRHETANAIVQHVVYALVQGFLLEEEHGPVVRQHPWTSTRGLIRVCRSAEDGTRDALNGRSWHPCGEELRLPVDNARFCATIKTEVSWGREGQGLTCEEWMDARRPDVFAIHDGI